MPDRAISAKEIHYGQFSKKFPLLKTSGHFEFSNFSQKWQNTNLLLSPGGGHIIFVFFCCLSSAVWTLGFRSFKGKVFMLSLPNLVWVFIRFIACMFHRNFQPTEYLSKFPLPKYGGHFEFSNFSQKWQNTNLFLSP